MFVHEEQLAPLAQQWFPANSSTGNSADSIFILNGYQLNTYRWHRVTLPLGNFYLHVVLLV